MTGDIQGYRVVVVFFRFSKVFQMVFVKQKSGNKSLKTPPFHLGMKHIGMLRSGKGGKGLPGSFRDVTYGDVKNNGRIVWEETYTDVT